MGTATQYYVDLDSGNDSNTGTSSGDPWLTLQGAIDNIITLGKGAYGDRVNLWGSGDGDLDLSAYSTSLTIGLVLFGAGATSFGDGGRPTLDLNNNAMWSGGKQSMHLRNLILNNWITTDYMFVASEHSTVHNCQIEDADATYGIKMARYTSCVGNELILTNSSLNYGIFTNNNGQLIKNNRITGNGGHLISGGAEAYICHNILLPSSATSAILCGGDSVKIWNNTVVGSGTYGISVASGAYDGHDMHFNYLGGMDTAIGFPSAGVDANKISHNRGYKSGGLTALITSGDNVIVEDNLELTKPGVDANYRPVIDEMFVDIAGSGLAPSYIGALEPVRVPKVFKRGSYGRF